MVGLVLGKLAMEFIVVVCLLVMVYSVIQIWANS